MPERRGELDAVVRSRLLGPDEPVDASDWSAVVDRARRLRRASYRPYAVAAATVALAAAASLGVLVVRGAPPAAVALRLSLQGDGQPLVLYSAPSRVVESSASRVVAEPASLVRSLTGGPFGVDAALVRAAAARPVSGGPLPGDQALYSLRLFTTAGLARTAGSAVLTCRYGVDRLAYCNGVVDLDDGMRVTASGTLSRGADHVALVVSSRYCRSVARCGRLSAIKVFGPSSHSRM
jgi:hypothetical protein